jgi:hypothetical protein
VDFGEADVILRGETTRVALFVMMLPYSDTIFCQVFPCECTEAFLEGHRRAFEFFGGVPRRISYDNSKISPPLRSGQTIRKRDRASIGESGIACHRPRRSSRSQSHRAAGAFLYVADCKLATVENMAYLHQHQGRFVTVLPRTRAEDDAFRAALPPPHDAASD